MSNWGHPHSIASRKKISKGMKKYCKKKYSNIDISKLFIVCKFCGNKKFFNTTYMYQIKHQKFCSKSCLAKSRKGIPHRKTFPDGVPEYFRKAISEGRQKRFNHITKEWLIENYIDKKKSAVECAKLVNCSYTVIYRRLEKFNIPIRNNSECQKGLQIGENHPLWKGGKVIRQCYICSKNILRGRWKKLIKVVCSKRCLSELHKKFNSGENCYRWKGGITPEQKLLRSKGDNKNWRRSIFIRDDFTCKKCGERNIYIQAHHIKSWSKYPKLRFDINNGMTLCKNCHKKVHRREYVNF